MIYEFSFKNFRSYKEETTISFVSKSINEHEDSLINTIDESLLPVSVIYGPNGGGKSSVLSAFGYMVSLIVLPFISMKMTKETNENDSVGFNSKRNSLYRRESFNWDEHYDEVPSDFSILFQKNDRKFRYEISVLDDEVISEALYVQTGDDVDIFFERDGDSITVTDKIQIPIDSGINKSLPFLVYLGVLLDIDEINEAISFFLSVKYIDYDRRASDFSIPIRRIIEDKERILSVTMKMGIPIADFEVEENDDGEIKNVYSKHVIDGKVSNRKLNFILESSGTRKIFSLIHTLMRSIDTGSIVLIDELDAKLHPLLLQTIISLYTNPEINKNGAQLLFTSHDIITMNNEVFRRDEIWFSAINDESESFLYSLADFKKSNGKKPRKDEMYGKQYLEGRYGADPYIVRILDWED